MTTPAPTLMRGQPVADKILARCRPRVAAIVAQTGVRPCLAVVLAGGDRLAARYLERKRRACADLGMTSRIVQLPAATGTEALVRELTALGQDPAVHAILLQYPLPPAVDEPTAFAAVPAAKDIDGLSPANPGVTSCTAEAVRELLAAYGVRLAGQRAVVVGQSATVAQPLAKMLARNVRVTTGDPDASELPRLVATADLVVAAVGRPRFVRGEWLKAGAVVIDTGLNTVAGKPVGDVDFESAAARAAHITPVPGGVGPVTLAVLMARTARAAAHQLGLGGE